MSEAGYYRHPSIQGDTVVFVCEDDLWTVAAEGGTARRLTVGPGRALWPALSPDGRLLAYVGHDEGSPEIYSMPAAGGEARRLTYAGASCQGTTWTPDGRRIVFSTNAGQAFAGHYELRAVEAEGGPVLPLPLGPALTLSFDPRPDGGGGAVIGRNSSDIARWKRYRGGQTGDLWIDPAGGGDWRRLIRLPGNTANPLWLADRIYFVSDHEGVGNLYSCDLGGQDLRRHTTHADYYVRHPASDGRRIVYHAGADLYLFDPAAQAAAPIAIALHSPRVQRKRRFVQPERYLQSYDLHPQGHFLALVSRGKAFSGGNWEGAMSQHGVPDGVRYRLATWLADGERLVMVSDAAGEEALELHRVESLSGRQEERRLDGLDIGRPDELLPAPYGSLDGIERLALTNHRQELVLVDLEKATARVLDRSRHDRIKGVAWSPDGRWLAYGFADTAQTSILKLCRLEDGACFPITRTVLHDMEPAFDPAGRYLYFLSLRDFAPVYDSLTFDLGFPFGMRPHLVTLQADLPSPFQPLPRPLAEGLDDAADEEAPPESEGEGGEAEGDAGPPRPAGGPGDAGTGVDPAGGPAAEAAPEPLRIDLEGIADRVLAFPVPEGLYGSIAALEGKVLYSTFPLESPVDTGAETEGPGGGALELFDLEGLEERNLVEAGVSDFQVSADLKTLVYRSGHGLRVIKAGEKPPREGPPGRKSGWVDLGRLRVSVDPHAEWTQMLREAWRLQRDHFWSPDMGGVDWQGAYLRYLPLIARVATRAEFSDLMWELQGELGTSHAYEMGGDYRPEPRYAQGYLGADFRHDPERGGYRVERLLRGDLWDEATGSPLARAGVGVRVGDRLLAIDGQALGPERSPEQALVNRAGAEVVLRFAPGEEEEPEPGRAADPEGSGQPDRSHPSHGAHASYRSAGSDAPPASLPEPSPFYCTVRCLSSETPARYRDWVEANRRQVHEATGGRVGYLHIPDMGATGYAEFYRGFLAELHRDGLVVDVRYNSGGHVSQLILEKLTRRRLGYDVQRWGDPVPYPQESLGGPLILLVNEQTGSDGDMFSHAFKLLRLGLVVGTRTWGGVIGIRPRESFVDGGIATQPELSMWFKDVGFSVENQGITPDLEVEVRPQDHAAGRDPQLERALEEIQRQLREAPPERPSFGEGPRLPPPDLPEMPA